jgi:hypothetical protein
MIDAVAEPFLYQSPLVGRGIRLLSILPASGTEPIRISLCEKLLDGRVSFLALSYVWGSPDVTQEIICNGESLMVTEKPPRGAMADA